MDEPTAQHRPAAHEPKEVGRTVLPSVPAQSDQQERKGVLPAEQRLAALCSGPPVLHFVVGD